MRVQQSASKKKSIFRADLMIGGRWLVGRPFPLPYNDDAHQGNCAKNHLGNSKCREYVSIAVNVHVQKRVQKENEEENDFT